MHFIDSALISKYGELHDFFLHTWRPSGPGPRGFSLKDKIYKMILLSFYIIIVILYTWRPSGPDPCGFQGGQEREERRGRTGIINYFLDYIYI